MLPHVAESDNRVRTGDLDAVENRFVVRSPVAKPLEQCSAVIHLGPDWSPFSASGRERSLREAEADCRAPQLRLVVDRSPEGAMPTPSQQVHPDAERVSAMTFPGPQVPLAIFL